MTFEILRWRRERDGKSAELEFIRLGRERPAERESLPQIAETQCCCFIGILRLQKPALV